jgi:hypothetical protein
MTLVTSHHAAEKRQTQTRPFGNGVQKNDVARQRASGKGSARLYVGTWANTRLKP